MSKKEEFFIDYAAVRDRLLHAQERRGGFLTYEQKAALQHAEWAASDHRNGYKTESAVFEDMYKAFSELEKLEKYPELAAKLAELMPMSADDVRAVLASRRISIDNEDIDAILDITRQNLGVE